MKKDEFVDLMRQQGWTAEEVKEMVEVPLCGCVRAGVPGSPDKPGGLCI